VPPRLLRPFLGEIGLGRRVSLKIAEHSLRLRQVPLIDVDPVGMVLGGSEQSTVGESTLGDATTLGPRGDAL